MVSSVLQGLRRIDILSRAADAAAWLRGMRGVRRLLVAAGFGAASALAYAPFYAWPILFLTFPALVFIIDGTDGARRPWAAAAICGWAFGAGYFFIGLHWVGFAFVVDAKRHAWLLPFVAVLFPGGLALFFAAAAGVARLRWSVGSARVVLLAASVAAAEWLRGHILTGLPWNLPGYAWSGFDAMFQITSLIGVYGLSLATLVAVLSPAAVFDADGRRSSQAWPLIVPPAILAALFLFGWIRLPSAPAPVFPDIALRIVQPNVPQAEKWKQDLMERNWRTLLDLTRAPGLETRTHVIWTEAAPPFLLLSEPVGLKVIAEVLPPSTTLLTGVVRRDEEGGKQRFFNSMAAISGDGRVLGVYDKWDHQADGGIGRLYRRVRRADDGYLGDTALRSFDLLRSDFSGRGDRTGTSTRVARNHDGRLMVRAVDGAVSALGNRESPRRGRGPCDRSCSKYGCFRSDRSLRANHLVAWTR